jgi:hypothetical protein
MRNRHRLIGGAYVAGDTAREATSDEVKTLRAEDVGKTSPEPPLAKPLNDPNKSQPNCEDDAKRHLHCFLSPDCGVTPGPSFGRSFFLGLRRAAL